MAKYVYPVVLTAEKDGSYSLNFPDIESCYSQGDDLNDALVMAKDVLELVLYKYEKEKKPVPEPSDIKNIKTKKNEIVSLVNADTFQYRKRYENKSVNKTVTLPAWLNVMAEEAGLNFSGSLQSSLKQQLKIDSTLPRINQ